MIRRNTWILLVILAALVGTAFYLKDRQAKAEASATPTPGSTETQLFAASEGQPTDISVKDSAGKAVELARNADGKWVLKAPTDAEANQGSAEAAATQVTSLRVLSSVPLGFEVVGLDKPGYTMSFTFSSGKTHTLAVGALTPIQDGYYTSLDGGPVRIVDKQGLDALTQLLSQPPYAATPTPPITPTTELPIPTETLEATVSPSGTVGAGVTETAIPGASDTPAATGPTATPTP